MTKYVQAPLFQSDSPWQLPAELPNLSSAKNIGLDTETRDPQLIEKGPGVRRDGYLVGISVAVPEGVSWYLPFGHSEGKQFDRDKILLWAKDNLCNPNQPKVGANLIYDLDYLYHAGVKVSGPFYDIQNAEPLIDENAYSYSLNTLCKKYLGEEKREDLLEQVCADWGLKGKVQKHLWRFDPKYTGLYAEGDADQALRIFEKQKVILQQQELETVFDIETRLIPMLLHMRQTGVPINVDRLVDLHEERSKELEQYKQDLDRIAGQHIDFWAAASIANVFDAMGMSYPRTEKKGQPSFTKLWLERHNSAISNMILKCRELDKFIGTFLQGSLLEMLVAGDRIHCQFNQLRGDEFGTVTGRFSSSNPNLQFIPSRTEQGKICRKLFIPDLGYDWYKADYSQVEIRILAHYAMGPGAAEVVREFCENPNVDYHAWCAKIAGVSRKHAKTVNFGIVYGMGAVKLANDLGISLSEAKDFMRQYFAVLPFIKRTVDTATKAAADRGFVRTLLGRRRRFDLWEPKDYDLAKTIKAKKSKKDIEEEVAKYKGMQNHKGYRYKMGVQRSKCYKAFNAADQGTAADIMKKAMVDVWESGVCNVIKPYITVHDELDFGSPKTKEGREAAKEVKHIMENTMKLKVPLKVDLEVGSNWGNVKEVA